MDVAAAYGAHDAKQAVLGARQVPQRVRPPRDLCIEPGAASWQTRQQEQSRSSRTYCRHLQRQVTGCGVLRPMHVCSVQRMSTAKQAKHAPQHAGTRTSTLPPLPGASLLLLGLIACILGRAMSCGPPHTCAPACSYTAASSQYMRLLQLPHPGHTQQHGLLRWLRHH